MLKTSSVTAVILMLGLPSCTLAKPAENSRSEPANFSERLPFTRVNNSSSHIDGKQPCEGNSAKEFLEGKCDQLKGFDRLRDVRIQSSDGNRSIPPFYEFSPIHRIQRGTFVKEASGRAWHIYGDEGTNKMPPFFDYTPRIYRRHGDFSKKSVDDFMEGKKDRLRGIDVLPDEMKKLPPAWGGGEFDTQGFTQSGQPYQHVDPLYGIAPPRLENFNPGFKIDQPKLENSNQPQKKIGE